MKTIRTIIQNLFITYIAELKKFDLETFFIIGYSTFILLLTLYIKQPRLIFPRAPFLERLVLLGLIYGLSPLLPLILFRNKLKDYGISIGNCRVWLKDLLVFFCIMLVILIVAFKFTSLKSFYPIYKKSAQGVRWFLIYQAIQLFHMFCWEYFFRGFMLFGLAKKLDKTTAILIQTIPFALLHYRKPAIEAYGSIFAGVFQGIIGVRAGSFLPCAILHFLVALSADILGIIF